VTSARIGELLTEKGYEIDRRRIDLRDPIKEVGEHAVPIKLHRDVVASVKLTVHAEGEEAAIPDGNEAEPSATSEQEEQQEPESVG
jgi:large subunit ribosomal protein L9